MSRTAWEESFRLVDSTEREATEGEFALVGALDVMGKRGVGHGWFWW